MITHPYNYVFILPPKDQKKWVLNTIFTKILEQQIFDNSTFVFYGEKLPKAKNYIFSHYMFFIHYYLKFFSPLHFGRSFIYMTHFEPGKFKLPLCLIKFFMKRATGVITMNSASTRELIQSGFQSNRVRHIIGGFDASIFYNNRSYKKKLIGISTAYYDRKNPDLIFDVIQSCPQYNFVLLGQGWKKYSKFKQMKKLANFRYLEIPYQQYVLWYRQMKVFLSLSLLEGGPISLLESMACGAIPIASDTGFARDVITNDSLGYVVKSEDMNVDRIKKLINLIFKNIKTIDATELSVTKYSWKNYGYELKLFINSFK